MMPPVEEIFRIDPINGPAQRGKIRPTNLHSVPQHRAGPTDPLRDNTVYQADNTIYYLRRVRAALAAPFRWMWREPPNVELRAVKGVMVAIWVMIAIPFALAIWGLAIWLSCR